MSMPMSQHCQGSHDACFLFLYLLRDTDIQISESRLGQVVLNPDIVLRKPSWHTATVHFSRTKKNVRIIDCIRENATVH
jgi:hypothetical protein